METILVIISLGLFVWLLLDPKTVLGLAFLILLVAGAFLVHWILGALLLIWILLNL